MMRQRRIPAVMAQEQAVFHGLPRDASGVAAGLVRFSEFFAGDSAVLNNRVYLTYSALVTMSDDIGLEPEDFVLMHVYLERVRCVAPELLMQIPVRDQLMIAAYMTQALMYDEPLHKRTWLKFSGQLTWPQFIELVLCFCDIMDYQFGVSASEFDAAYTSLATFNVAAARNEKARVAAEAEAAAATQSNLLRVKLSRVDGQWVNALDLERGDVGVHLLTDIEDDSVPVAL